MYKLGLDIGGTEIKWYIFNQDKELIEQGTVPAFPKQEYKLEVLKKSLLQVIEIHKDKNFTNVGISSMSAPTAKGLYTYSWIESMINWNIVDFLSEYIKAEYYVLPDGVAMLSGQIEQDKELKDKNIAAITIGTGLGGGLYLDKNFKYGSTGNFFAASDFYVYGDQWTKSASTTALRTNLEKINKETGREVIEKGLKSFVEKTNDASCKVVDQWYESIADGLVSVQAAFDVDIVIFGGGISANDNFNVKEIEKRLKEKLPTLPGQRLEIRKAINANLSNAIGVIK